MFNDKEVLRSIFNSVKPAKNLRIRFVKEVIDQILIPDDQGDGNELQLSDFKSQMPTDVNVNSLFPGLKLKAPTEAEKELLAPVFNYDATLCEKGWMYLETWKHGIHKKAKEKREKYKSFHAEGVFRSHPIFRSYRFNFPSIPYRYRSIPHHMFFPLQPLRNFWTEFMGHTPSFLNRRNSYYCYDYCSFSADRTVFLYDESSGFKVGRKKFTFSDGRIVEKISYHKQFPNGVWFQIGYDLIRYPDPEKGLEGRYRKCIRVMELEFDIDLDPKTYKLPEGIDAVSMPTP